MAKRNRRSALVLLVTLAVLLAGVTAVWTRMRQSAAVAPLHYDARMLPEQSLHDLALTEAHKLGLVGSPASEFSTLATLGTLLTLESSLTTSAMLAPAGLTRETPIYVYQVTGDIPTLNTFAGMGPAPYSYQMLVIYLMAETGAVYGGSAVPVGSVLPDFSRLPADAGNIEIAVTQPFDDGDND